MKKLKIKNQPQIIFLLSFLGVILLGMLLLMLPISTSSRQGLNVIDALFVATSATCVTGLSTITPGTDLSLFGQIILIILIEIGGLSFVTIFSFFLIISGVKIDINSKYIMKETLNQDTMKGIYSLVKKIIAITLSIQAIGTLCFFFIFKFKYQYSFGYSLIYSIFHTISSFNNAGFDIFTNGEYSLLYFHQDALFMILTMILIILGGIGFIVMIDIYKKRRWSKFSFHTKVVLIMSLILLVIGTLLVKLGYYISGNQISWLDACFQSVTCRTAGFASVDLTSLSSNHVAYLTMLFLMFIGAAPCSTGGGFKVTSFFVLVVMGYNFIQGKRVHVLKRKISQESIFKAYVLFFFEMMYILIAILVISCFESIYQGDISLLEIIFEVVSGFATVGLSLGITSSLCIFSKIILVITMFIGRLGPLTLLSLWNNRSKAILDRKIDYAEGKIIIG